MQDHVLRDRANKVIGYIKAKSNGELELRDSKYVVKGYYDPKTNVTRDAKYQRVGSGNILTTLL